MIGQFHENPKLRKRSMAQLILSAMLARSLWGGIGGLRLGGCDTRAGEIFGEFAHLVGRRLFIGPLFSRFN